jgi:hypothetical protein
MGWVDDLIDDAVNAVVEPIYNWFRSMGNSIASVFNDIGQFFKDLVMAPIDGIDKMIADINEIVCFIKILPKRLQNIQHGVNNIFVGIVEQFEALGTAIELGYKDTKNLLIYTGEFVNTYIQCMVKMIKNFYKCAIFYVLEVFGKLLMLPFRIFMWIAYTYFRVDLYSLEQGVWDIINWIDKIVFSFIGIHFAHYPKSIREDCYTCVRLKREAVREKANDLDYTFTKTIPELMTNSSGACKIRRGKDQLDEVSKMPTARHPDNIP